jgi:hypothetical protein
MAERGATEALSRRFEMNSSDSASVRGSNQLATAPHGPRIEELGPRQAQQQDRLVSRPVRHVFQQIEERRLGPLEVVEDRDQWPSRGHCLQELAYRPVGLLGCRRHSRDAEELRQTFGDQLSLGGIVEKQGDLRAHVFGAAPLSDPGGIGQNLDDRPIT